MIRKRIGRESRRNQGASARPAALSPRCKDLRGSMRGYSLSLSSGFAAELLFFSSPLSPFLSSLSLSSPEFTSFSDPSGFSTLIFVPSATAYPPLATTGSPSFIPLPLSTHPLFPHPTYTL